MSQHLFARGPDGTRIYVRRRAVLASGSSSLGARSADSDRVYSESASDRTPPTAVLCDGIACDGFIWKYLWDDLPAWMPVAHWHYRGHGRSSLPVDPERIALADHVHDLDAVRREIGGGPVVLFGHSMGCQVALEAYRLHKEGIRALVLVCGSSGRITHTFRGSNVLAQVLPGLIQRVDAHPNMARALWSRVPTDLSLRIALLSGEVDAKSVRPEDLMPYMKHMVDI